MPTHRYSSNCKLKTSAQYNPRQLCPTFSTVPVQIVCEQTEIRIIILDPAYNQFGYNEHADPGSK